MVHIQSATAEIRRREKRRKKEERKIETTGQKYNIRICCAGGHKSDAKIAIWAPSHKVVGLYLRN